MRALLVVNPKATATSAGTRDVLAHALASAVHLEVVETKARGHAVEVAAAAVDEVDLVVALGGDGTVNEVVNGLLARGPRPGLPALAVVPGGSTNVFARALGLPNAPVEATHVLLAALAGERRRSIGLGLAVCPGEADRWFTVNAGLGLDADVVRRVDRERSRGRPVTPARYVRAGVRQFFLHTDHRRPALLLERPGEPAVPVGLALVCNTRPWTYLLDRPVDPCPRASFDAGLDVFALRRTRTGTTLRHLRQILARTSRPHGRSLLQVHDADSLVLSCDRPRAFQLDGEDLGDRTRVELRGVRAALQVVV